MDDVVLIVIWIMLFAAALGSIYMGYHVTKKARRL